MKRFAILATALLSLIGFEQAAAQYPGPTPYGSAQSPPISPYLNLLRNRSPSANYFFGVAPFIYSQPAQQIPGLDLSGQRRPGLDQLDDFIPVLPETGHAVLFQNYGTYYKLGKAPPSNVLNPLQYRSKR